MNRPPLSCQQMRRFDQLAIEQLGIPSLVLMENAGAGAAHLLIDVMEQEQQLLAEQVRAVVVCGGGNNGGDGLVIARHLHNYGAHVDILLAAEAERLSPDTAVQLDISQRMGLSIAQLNNGQLDDAAMQACAKATLLIDCLLGTGFQGPVRDTAAVLINALNSVAGPLKVAIDLPSGLDGDSGEPDPSTFIADMTITFVAPKRGLLSPAARDYVGEVEIVDIGAPLWLLRDVGQG